MQQTPPALTEPPQEPAKTNDFDGCYLPSFRELRLQDLHTVCRGIQHLFLLDCHFRWLRAEDIHHLLELTKSFQHTCKFSNRNSWWWWWWRLSHHLALQQVRNICICTLPRHRPPHAHHSDNAHDKCYDSAEDVAVIARAIVDTRKSIGICKGKCCCWL